MTDDLNTVKTADGDSRSARRDAYHHGALREALVRAADAVIRERGVDGFSLRETARRAGVSPAASQHHFGDARGLLTAVAAAGFEGLAEALEAADRAANFDGLVAALEAADQDVLIDRRTRLHRQGAAYVAFALAEPARFDVMWRLARIDRADPTYASAAARAYALLSAAVEGEAADPAGLEFGPDPRTVAAWSLVHGFARLALDGAFGEGPDAARRAADALLPAVMRALEV